MKTISNVLLSAIMLLGLTANASPSSVSFNNNQNEISIVRAKLVLKNSNFSEETVIVFKEGASALFIAREDVSYSSNVGQQIVSLSSLTEDNKNTVINYMPTVCPAIKVKLNVGTINTTGAYQLNFDTQLSPGNYSLWLHDKLLAKAVLIQQGDNYSFNIDKSKPETFGSDRFSLSFTEITTLPVTLNSFTATKDLSGIQLTWSSSTENNLKKYEIYRAGDDKNFKIISTSTANNKASTYAVTDKNPLIGNNYYQLVSIDRDGKTEILDTKVIFNNNSINQNLKLKVFPTVIKQNCTVKLENTTDNSQKQLTIYNIQGQKFLNSNLKNQELTEGYQIDLSNYKSGIYFFIISNTEGKVLDKIKVIKQ